MKCAACEEEARGVCRFCGKGVCRTHSSGRRFVSGWRFYYGLLPGDQYDFSVVDNALWCGQCVVRDYASAR